MMPTNKWKMVPMEKQSNCSCTLMWKEKKKGTICFSDPQKGEIEVAVPPEFRGHQNIATPEDLFLSAVNTCFMSYFLNVVENLRIKLVSYSSHATDTLAQNGIDFIISGINLTVDVVVKTEKDAKKARRALELSKKGCHIANSIRAEVIVDSSIRVEEDETGVQVPKKAHA